MAAPHLLAGTEKYHPSPLACSVEYYLQQVLDSARIKDSYSAFAACDPRVAKFPKPTVAAGTKNGFECFFTEAGGAYFP
jgi:hypothetical protein